MATEGLLETLFPEGPGVDALTEDDHDFGIQRVDDPGQGATQQDTGVAVDVQRSQVVRPSSIEQVGGGPALANGAACDRFGQQRDIADSGFQAASGPARAVRSVVGDGDVADLAGPPVRAAV